MATTPYDKWPTPLAYALQRYEQSQENATLALLNACHLVEVGLKMLIAVALGDLWAKTNALPPKVAATVDYNLEKPTLGSWTTIAQVLCGKKVSKNSISIPAWRESLRGHYLPFLAPEGNGANGFMAVRNLVAHSSINAVVAKRVLDRWNLKIRNTLSGLDWLCESQLLVRTDRSYFAQVLGPKGDVVVLREQDVPYMARCNQLTRSGQEVLIHTGQAIISLWPLFIYDHLRDEDAGESSRKALLMYMRRGPSHLDLVPFGDEEFIKSVSDKKARDALQLRLVMPITRRYRVRSFKPEIQGRAQELRGRSRELAQLCHALNDALQSEADPKKRLLWVHGPAGIGKSFIVSWLVDKLISAEREDLEMGRVITSPNITPDQRGVDVLLPQGLKILPYRFKQGDERCSVSQFLQFVYERLSPPPRMGRLATALFRQCETLQEQLAMVCSLMTKAAETRKLVFILDGVGEINEIAPGFLENFLSPITDNSVWLLTSRIGLQEILPDCFEYTPVLTSDQLKMTDDDVRAVLIDTDFIKGAEAILDLDRQKGKRQVNAFIQQVVRASKGLPLYLKYLKEDLQRGLIKPDETSKLPPSLDKYHERLMERLDLRQEDFLRAPLAATLAVAREALTANSLCELMYHRDLLPHGDGEDLQAVEKSLSSLGSVISVAQTADGEKGYNLFHPTLGQHMRKNPGTRPLLEMCKRAFCRLANPREVKESGLRNYLFRRGIAHLVEQGMSDTAQSILCKSDYLMARLRALPNQLGVRQFSEDWDTLRREPGVGAKDRGILAPKLNGEAAVWEDFWRTREHLLLKGDETWPPAKILLQLGWEHAQDSPVTASFENWLRKQPRMWSWVRMKPEQRPERWSRGNLYRAFTAKNAVWSVAVSQDGALIAAGDVKGNIYCWDAATGNLRCEKKAHYDKIGHLRFTSEGRFLISGEDGGLVNVMDVYDNLTLRFSYTHDARLTCLDLAPDTGLLASGDGLGGVVLSDINSGQPRWQQKLHRTHVSALRFDPSGHLLASGDANGVVMVTDADQERPGKICGHHRGNICDLEWGDGLLVSAGMDNITIQWGLDNFYRQAAERHHHTDSMLSLVCLKPEIGMVALSINQRLVNWLPGQTAQKVQSINGTRGLGVCIANLPEKDGVVCGEEMGALRVWRKKDDWEVRLLGTHGDAPVLCVVVNESTRMAVSGGSDGQVKLWRLDADDQQQATIGHARPPKWVKLLAEGTRAVSYEDERRRLLIWDMTDGGYLGEMPQGYWWYRQALVWNGDGITALAWRLRDAALCMFDGRLDEPAATVLWPACDEPVWVALSPDGCKALAANQFEMRVWNLPQVAPISEYIADRKLIVKSITWNWGSGTAALALSNGAVMILPLDGGGPRTILNTRPAATSLAFDSRSKRLAMTLGSEKVGVYSLESDPVSQIGSWIWHSNISNLKVDNLAFGQGDQRLFAETTQPGIHCWRVDDGRKVGSWIAAEMLRVDPDIYSCLHYDQCGPEGLVNPTDRGLCVRPSDGSLVFWINDKVACPFYANGLAVFVPAQGVWTPRLLDMITKRES